jgi:hypothetical protein
VRVEVGRSKEGWGRSKEKAGFRGAGDQQSVLLYMWRLVYIQGRR